MNHICVLSGIHRGAVIEIGDTPVSIGGGDDCGALLSDVSAKGSIVSISRNPEGTLEATALGGVILRNGRRLRQDKQASLQDGAVIGIGGVDITTGRDLQSAEKSKADREKRHVLVSWVGVGAACLAVFGLMGAFGGPAGAFGSLRTVGSEVRTVEKVRVQRDPLIDLDRELTRTRLASVIDVTRTESGQILATGAVTTAERQRWNEIVRWFDGRFGDIAMLETHLTDRGDGYVMPFQIVSIYPSSNPRVVIQNGQTYPLGSILPGGWELREIARMKVVLARGGQELAISF